MITSTAMGKTTMTTTTKTAAWVLSILQWVFMNTRDRSLKIWLKSTEPRLAKRPKPITASNASHFNNSLSDHISFNWCNWINGFVWAVITTSTIAIAEYVDHLNSKPKHTAKRTHTHTKLIRTSFGLRAALMLAASRWCWRLTQIHRNTCPDEVAMPWNHQRELWKCFHFINQVSFILPFSHNQWGASFVSIQKQNQKKKTLHRQRNETDAKKERRKKMRMTRKRTTKQNQNIVFLLLWTKTTINDGKTILQSELNC